MVMRFVTWDIKEATGNDNSFQDTLYNICNSG